MKCCRRYVSQTFAINTFRFAIFSSKKSFPTRVFIHQKFFNHFVNIFVKKKLLIFLIFQNKNTKEVEFVLIGTLFNQSESSKLKKMILTKNALAKAKYNCFYVIKILLSNAEGNYLVQLAE